MTFRRGPSFLIIDDARTQTGRRRFVLDALESAIYLGCDAGCDAAKVVADMCAAGGVVDADDVVRILKQFVDDRLMHEEDGRYLSLANPEDRVRAWCESPSPALVVTG